MRRMHRRRGAIVLVWMILLALVLIAFVGLALDTAYVNSVCQQLQNAADAAALSGAEQLLKQNPSGAAAAAQTTAGHNHAAGAAVQLAANPSNDGAGDVVVGVYNRATGAFSATLTEPNAVQVLARRTTGSPGGPVGLFFAPMFGVQSSEISRSATAMLRVVYPAILVLDPHGAGAVSMNGTPTINVTGTGAVVVNSDSPAAVDINTNSTITATELDIGGNPGITLTKPPRFNTPVYPGQSPVADPLASLPEPASGPDQPANGYKIVNNVTYFAPGHYASISLGKKGNVLEPGVYVFDRGLDVGNNDLQANGVMLFVKDGELNLGGNGNVEITPPTSGTYAGVGIFQARGNSHQATMRGTSNMHILGTIYMPDATLEIGGTPQTLGNQIIVYRLSVSGTADINVPYDGRNPAPGRIFLVK